MQRSTGRPHWGPALVILGALLVPDPLGAAGNFVYTNNTRPDNTVSAFSVAANGTLTLLPGSPFPTGGHGMGDSFLLSSNSIAVAGHFLFASNAASGDVSVFTIDPDGGALTLVPGSPFPLGNFTPPVEGIPLSPTPDGSFLMAADIGIGGMITVFSIASTGALTPVPGSPFLAGVAGVSGIKVSPDGKFLAVTPSYYKMVKMFSIASTGALTFLGWSFEEGDGHLTGVDIDCSTSFLYAGKEDYRTPMAIVYAYTIAADGTLTPLAGSPFSMGRPGFSTDVLLSPDDKTLFVSNRTHDIDVLSVAPDGSLSLEFVATTLNPYSPWSLATSRDGTLLYAAAILSPAVESFRVASTGALTSAGQFWTGEDLGLHSLAAFPPKLCLQTVVIMIKPAAAPPVPINPKAKGKIPVAILSTPSFNALTEVAPSSLTFGHSGTEASLAFCGRGGQDVNGDGLLDLLCHFNTQQTGLLAGDTLAILKGKTVDGIKLSGSEAIRTVPH